MIQIYSLSSQSYIKNFLLGLQRFFFPPIHMITMFCIECGNPLPAIRNNHTICSKCKTPLSTWWDESSATFRTNRETILPDDQITFKSHLDPKEKEMMALRKNNQSAEERVFNAALICLEHHFERPMNSMSATMDRVRKIIATTLDLSLKKADVRYLDISISVGVFRRS